MIQSNNGTLKIHATSMDQTLWLPLTGNPCSNKTTAQDCMLYPHKVKWTLGMVVHWEEQAGETCAMIENTTPRDEQKQTSEHLNILSPCRVFNHAS